MFHLPLVAPIILAEATPNWTNKEVLIVIGTTITTLIPVCLVVIRLMTLSTLRRLRKSKARCEQLQKEFDLEQVSFAVPVDHSKFEQQFPQAFSNAQQLAADLQSTQGEKEMHRRKAEGAPDGPT